MIFPDSQNIVGGLGAISILFLAFFSQQFQLKNLSTKIINRNVNVIILPNYQPTR